MEPVTLAAHPVVTRATPDSVDTGELAAVAAHTFPLACPPSTAPENIASFVAANLSAAQFGAFLADPQRAVIVAQHDDRIIGYAMLVRGAADDTGVSPAELSKIYLLPDFHGSGAAKALMDAALAAAAEWGARSVWLGVNQKNQRAQRFYLKHGFKTNGTRTFQVGARREDDYVMVRQLG